MTRLQLSAGLAALLVTAASAADNTTSRDAPADPSFESLDRNGDNMISRPEAHAHDKVDSQFRALDRDGDGDLDRGEFARFEAGATPAAGEDPARLPGDPRIGPEPPNLPPPKR
jgi:Ca2+-binding EF-hand superfamily protein